MNIPQSVLLSAISFYRKVVSPFLPASCRFYPSCSQYAHEAIGKHGAGRGAFMAIKRLGRCHPWHPGGVDPVEDAGLGSSRQAGTSGNSVRNRKFEI